MHTFGYQTKTRENQPFSEKFNLFGTRCFELIFIAVALVYSLCFAALRLSLNIENGPASLTALVNGSASKPFQYRILIPWLAGLIHGLKIPFLSSLGVIFVMLETAAVFLLIITFRYYVSLFIQKGFRQSVFSLSLLYVLPFNFILARPLAFYYPYDIPSIFFFTLGLAFMYQKNGIFITRYSYWLP